MHNWDAEHADRATCVAGDFLLSETVYRPGERMRPHSHDFAKLSLLVAGTLAEEADRAEVCGRAGTVVLKARGVRHATRFGDHGARMFVLARLEPQAGDTPTGYLALRPGRFTAPLFAVYQAWKRGEPVSWLEERALEAWSGLEEESPAPTPPTADRRLDRVRELLHARADEPVGLREAAAEVNLHPVYLARLFRRRFGCSVCDYVQWLRLQRAAELLRAPGTGAAVSQAAGFSDQPEFCRRFRRWFGITPGDYRRLIGAAGRIRAGLPRAR